MYEAGREGGRYCKTSNYAQYCQVRSHKFFLPANVPWIQVYLLYITSIQYESQRRFGLPIGTSTTKNLKNIISIMVYDPYNHDVNGNLLDLINGSFRNVYLHDW